MGNAVIPKLQAEEEMWIIGLNANCPVHQITCGGQNFPRTSEDVSGYGAETKRKLIQGAVVRMQPGQMKKVWGSAEHKIIRATRGKKSRARVHDTRSHRYRRMDGDVPVLDFMYAKRTDPFANPHSVVMQKTMAQERKEQREQQILEQGERTAALESSADKATTEAAPAPAPVPAPVAKPRSRRSRRKTTPQGDTPQE